MCLITRPAQATSRDTQYGAVTSYIASTPTVDLNSQGTGSSTPDYSVVVKLTRASLTYESLLTLRQIGGNWKIIDYDRI